MTRLDTLRTAVRTAIRNHCPRSEISVPHWARSFGVTMKQVREIWEAELTKVPPSYEGGPEGK
jgi:hypothetical protein